MVFNAKIRNFNTDFCIFLGGTQVKNPFPDFFFLTGFSFSATGTKENKQNHLTKIIHNSSRGVHVCRHI